MPFRDSLWDDSEPDYAPCCNRIRKNFVWVCPNNIRDAGYSIKTMVIGPAGDAPTVEQAAKARELTREAITWFNGEEEGRTPGTWGWLIARYKTDSYSAIWDVQPSTRETYKAWLNRIDNAIGEVSITDTDFPRLKLWQTSMIDKGRSTDYVSKWFTHFGLVVSHGIKLDVSHCAKVKAIRGEMRITSPSRRSVAPSRAQIEAVVEEADRRGWHQCALVVLMRYELILRGTDIHGAWEPAEGREDGGIMYHGRRWDKGLTWDMVSPDVTSFTKVISKTAKSMPEPYTFDLTAVPEIQKRLLAIPEHERVGPVIKMDDGLPPRSDKLTKQFKAIVRDLPDLPDDLRMMDNRAGGITEAKSLVDQFTLRDAAQHTLVTTTNGYVRGRSDAANKVVQMRARTKK